MIKTITYNLSDGTSIISEQYDAENNVTEVVFDYTDCGVDAWAKWMDVKLADGSQTSVPLGTSLVPSYTLPASYMQRGRLELQPFAIGSLGERLAFSVKGIYVQRSLATAEQEIPYDPTTLSEIQDAISALQISNVPDKHYNHEQVVPSSTWVIPHNLNKTPAVHVFNGFGQEVVGSITHNSLNQLTIVFSGAFSGHAYLN